MCSRCHRSGRCPRDKSVPRANTDGKNDARDRQKSTTKRNGRNGQRGGALRGGFAWGHFSLHAFDELDELFAVLLAERGEGFVGHQDAVALQVAGAVG